MLDDFFIRALIAGLGIAIVTGPLGCFVIWRRLSYFGDTLAHSALLGVTLAYTLEFNIAISVARFRPFGPIMHMYPYEIKHAMADPQGAAEMALTPCSLVTFLSV